MDTILDSQYLTGPIFTPADRPPLENGGALYLSPVAAGFPSPAEDYIESSLDLHSHIVRNRQATFFVRAAGDSMVGAGIMDGDLLVVDRSLDPVSGSVVIAALDGELTVKRLLLREGRILLMPENDAYPELDISGREDTVIWGVVTYALHSLARKGASAVLGAR